MFSRLLPLLLLTFTGLLPGAPIEIAVSVNTAPLIGAATSPYYVEFQLVDGDGVSNNPVLIDSFLFGGGSAAGTPDLTGGASGSLATAVNLEDSTFFTSFYQEFTPGAELSFRIVVDPAFAGGTPDRLTFAILNSALFELSTTGPGFELMGVDLRMPLNVELYAGIPFGDDPVLSAPAIAGIPEPSSFGLMVLGGSLILALSRRQRSSR